MNFNAKIYEVCKRIPKGKVSTYGEIAKVLKSKGYRAVGNALRANQYPDVIPCFRVVNSKGELHGFAEGLKAKKTLLEKEGVKIKGNKILDFNKIMYKF